MKLLQALQEVIGGSRAELESEGTARQLRLALAATGATALAAALYGVSVAGADPTLAVGNLLKVPMVVVLSTVAALPGGLLAARLTDAQIDTSSIITSLASANFTGSLVLVSAAPVVGLYYLTGSSFSGYLGLGAAFFAEVVAAWVFFRAASKRRPEDVRKRDILLPLLVIMGIQVVTLVQLIGIASPILPEVTPFSHGMEGLVAK